MHKSEENFIQDQIIRSSYNYDQIYHLLENDNIGSDSNLDFKLLFERTIKYIQDNFKLLGNTFSNIEYHSRFGWIISRNRSKAYLGKINLAGNSKMDIGNRTYLSGSSTINGNNNLNIGSYCSLADGIELFTSNINHPTGFATTYNLHSNSRVIEGGCNVDLPNFQKEIDNLKTKQNITIGNDVWIGRDVMVMNGIKIPDGCVIGARSTITKDCKPYGIYVGTPAKLIRYRFNENIIGQLERIKWWNWEWKKIQNNKLFFDTRLTEFSGNLRSIIQ